MTGLGQRLSEAMAARNHSARSLALALAQLSSEGVTRTTISAYVKETRSPTASVLIAISEALGVDAAWLLTGRGAMVATQAVGDADLAPWAPEAVQERIREAAGMTAVASGAFGSESLVQHAAHRVAWFLEAAVGLALGTVNLKSDNPPERVAAIYKRIGSSQAYGDALGLLLVAHHLLVWPLVVQVAITKPEMSQSDETLAAEPVQPNPSVAPSVGKPHKKAENNPKRPKSKKGQPRG